MSSSESEDDCYANVAQKLQKMKNTYQSGVSDFNTILHDSKDDSRELEEIIKKSNINVKNNEDIIEILGEIASPQARRITRSASKKTKIKEASQSSIVENVSIVIESDVSSVPNNNRFTSRGRGRKRGEGSGATQVTSNSASLNIQPSTSNRNASNSRVHSRRNRGRRSNICDYVQPTYPVYSIGNTAEYTDQSESQPLFSNNNAKTDDVVLIEDNEDLDANEELSVKVYWQSSEFFKFSIRKYQKITQIFDHFSHKETVSHDKLLFTYNDKILNPNDTPDSINYSIVKFIEGGIVNQSLSKLVLKENKTIRNGIRIKFQCLDVKKPVEITIGLNDKLSVAMLKYAEHLEKPIEKLKFEFDGDSISGKMTAKELELEGGECIDVKILS